MSFCATTQDCPGERFDIKKLASIRGTLDVDWLSCPQHGSTNEKFWEHEWSKHGTCTGLSQLDYFNVTLGLLHKHSHLCSSTVQVPLPPFGFVDVPNKEGRLCINDKYELCN